MRLCTENIIPFLIQNNEARALYKPYEGTTAWTVPEFKPA